mmetsp:Transcript_48733/g.109693  ORF Transcript_48733/g.109693 Transcript_48733/m.109693 type:complete len:217 (-) Transcript_48733:317-967(-)
MLGGGDRAPHRLHRLARELADGTLPREHHSVTAVKDGIRHIAHLGARRHWRVDHRLHHLRGGDAELVRFVRLLDQKFLSEGHSLKAQLHTHVAARNHQSVRECQNLIDVGERRWLLDLGDDEWPLRRRHPLGVHDVNQLLDIGALLHERHGHVVNFVQQVLGIIPILGGEGSAVNLQIRHIDALARLERTADRDHALDLVCRHALRHLHREEAVVQ